MKRLIITVFLAAVLAAGAGCKKEGAEAKPGQVQEPVQAPADVCASMESYGGVDSVPPPEGEDPSGGDMFVRRLDAEPATLNPIIATDQYGQDISLFVFDSLLDADLDTGDIKPNVAESWEVGEDNVTFTFHLRQDVKFHDGKPLTADDVVYTFARIMDPKVDAASYRSYFGDMESFEKTGPYTVRIKWKKKYFKALEMIGGTPILPRHILDDGADFNSNPYNRKPIGSGSYRLTEWTTGQSITLEKNRDYWGKKPHFDKIKFRIITDDAVALRVLREGQIDFIERLRPVQWVKDTNGPEFLARFHKIKYDYPTYSYIGWNLRKPLFQDKRVRQALTMLLDRESIRGQVFYCLATVSNGPFFYKHPEADPTIAPWPFDPQRAQRILAEAGWRDTDNDGVLDRDGQPFRFELSFTAAVPEWEQIANIFREQLKKAGIDMEIRKMEWASFLKNVQDWKFDACAMGWALVSDPDSFQIWHGSQADIPASSNHVGYKNAEVDRLIEMNREEFDRDKRVQNSREIHRIIHEDQPYTFVTIRKQLSVVDKRVHNLVPHANRPIFYFNDWYAPENLQKYRDTP